MSYLSLQVGSYDGDFTPDHYKLLMNSIVGSIDISLEERAELVGALKIVVLVVPDWFLEQERGLRPLYRQEQRVQNTQDALNKVLTQLQSESGGYYELSLASRTTVEAIPMVGSNEQENIQQVINMAPDLLIIQVYQAERHPGWWASLIEQSPNSIRCCMYGLP